MRADNGRAAIRRHEADVLLIEDNPGDVRLVKEAFTNGKAMYRFHVVTDGAEALAFLRRLGRHRDAPRPCLILLDLNLPREDGRGVLQQIKGDPNLRRIPVVVLTTSEAEEDVLSAYSVHANCYIAKPADLDQFLTVVRRIQSFWLGTVVLPGR